MGLQFAALEIPLPLDLYGAVEQAGLVITLVPPENRSSPSHLESEVGEGLQESELADIYVIPLTLEGQLVEGFNTQLTTVPINMDAINQAIANGSDLRTIRVSNGTPVRILTYRVPNRTDVQVFQVGRYLSTQQQLLSQLLNAMIILGGVITIFIGAAAWILAGRT